MIEGPDSYENMGEIFENINELVVKTGKLPGINHPIVYWGGGDMPYMAECVGIGAHYGAKDPDSSSCAWCEVKKKDLWSVAPSELRTLERVHNQAHLPYIDSTGNPIFPFTCPSCGIVFASQAAVDEDVSPSDPSEYAKRHCFVSHHRRPLIDIEPQRWVPCCLHLKLSMVKLFWKVFVCPNVTTSQECKQVNDLLYSLGAYVK